MKLNYVAGNLSIIGLALLTMAGCGDGRPSLVPVSGTVTLNGSPLGEAQLGFEPDGIDGYSRPSFAITDGSGKFVVGTYDKADGMPKGKYKVTVFKKEIVGKPPENLNPEDTSASAQPVQYQWTVPQKYATSANSGLTVEVTSSGLNPAEIVLVGEPERESASRTAEP